MRKTVRWSAHLLLVVLLVGCSGTAGAPATVTVSTTVTDIKTVAEVQTAIVAPPAQTNTVTVTQTVTVARSAVTQTPTQATVSGVSGGGVTFDSAKVATGIRKVLTDAPPAGYGITGVTDTSCPNDQPVKIGTTFLCHATIDNASKSIRITVEDDAGKYEVGLPE